MVAGCIGKMITKTGGQELKRAKLYLLAAGVWFWERFFFMRKKGTEEPEKYEQEEQPAGSGNTGVSGTNDMEETEEAGKEKEEEKEEEKEVPEEPAPQPLEYSGSIRVLLKTDNYEKEIHEKIELSSASGQDLAVYDGETEEMIDSGSFLSFTREEDTLFLNGEPLAALPKRLVIRTAEGDGAGIALDSVKRGYGTPVYEGALEVWPAEEGFYLVNELPFETYLKYVVPSEMPSGYEKEALKAQAVCARTYACKQLQSYDFPECRAHVDDSVSYQVYNNTGAAESTSRRWMKQRGLSLPAKAFQ